MRASSNRTNQDWHPSNLLAYAAILNPQDDFDSISSEVKSTAETRTDSYDHSLTSRRFALAGVACSTIFSIGCIIAGTIIITTRGGNGAIQYYLDSLLQKEMLALIPSLIVTLCTESTGFVHGISLHSALASESRLRFNTNLRLLTAARGWRNPNGTLFNGVMAVLLILSYSSASLLTISFEYITIIGDAVVPTYMVAIMGVPLLLLGIALFLQVVIAMSGMRAVKILTWSSSPFDVTVALGYHAQLTPVPFRCMRNMSDLHMDRLGGPAKPSETQPSAWRAYRSIRKVVLSLWGLVIAYAVWAALVALVWDITVRNSEPSIPWVSWSFFPAGYSMLVWWNMPIDGGAVIQWWILSFVTVALAQGPLTLGLHCSELILGVIRDERQWRRATGRKGLKMTTSPLESFSTDPLSLVLFVAKPALHWMFSLAYTLHCEPQNSPATNTDHIESIFTIVYLTQILNLCIALLIFACFFTLVALRRPRGPQPAAYGHLQTLANLIDEWSPVMWWGHKEDGIPYCHAGTSDHPLPPVKMDCVYAGLASKCPSVSASAFTSGDALTVRTARCAVDE